MLTDLKVESNHKMLVELIILKLGLLGVDLGRADIKRICEMSDDELANVALDVGLENHGDTNPFAAKLGSLGVPIGSDAFFVSLLSSTNSFPTNDSSRGSLGEISSQNSRLASSSEVDATSITLPSLASVIPSKSAVKTNAEPPHRNLNNDIWLTES